jgi:hypothetical protein
MSRVLEYTRGKRVLVAGGQGARTSHWATVQKQFEFDRIDREFSERKQPKFFTNLALKMRSGKYDFVIFLAGYSSHRSVMFTEACRNNGVPVVYIPSGYGVNQVAEAIKRQILPKERKFA